MAVIWAKQAGSWNDVTDEGHVWMWHNPDTGQNEEYIVDGVRRLPDIGDTVYFNSYIITYTNDVNLGNGWLRNDANEEYGIVSGGRLQRIANGSTTITANCYADTACLFYNYGTNTTTYTVTIIGNCVCPSTATSGLVQGNAGGYARRSVAVVGNVDCSRGGCLAYNLAGVGTFSISGNVIIGNGTLYHCSTNYVNSSTITGKVTCADGATGSLTNVYFNTNNTLKIGSIDFSNGLAQLTTSTSSITHNVKISGDVKISNNLTSQAGGTATIGGDVYSNRGFYGTVTSITVNGSLTQISRSWGGSMQGQCRVNGDVHLLEGARLITYCYYLILGGNVYVDSNVATPASPSPLGCIIYTLTTPDDFRIIYTGDEYPQLMYISGYDLNNRQQYPSEDDVKKNVEYAYGAKKGKLEPVNNTNTINIYPNAKRYPL